MTDRLLADYLERVDALAVQVEILRGILENESKKGWNAAWQQAEDALADVNIAHFTLAQYSIDPLRQEIRKSKVVNIQAVSGD